MVLDVKQFKKLVRSCGPAWYNELSSDQQKMLASLKDCIHQDLIEDLPVRTRRCLQEIGLTAKLSNKILLNAMRNSIEDPGLFIWNLFTAMYKHSPSILRSSKFLLPLNKYIYLCFILIIPKKKYLGLQKIIFITIIENCFRAI